jgi:hypothetical protein
VPVHVVRAGQQLVELRRTYGNHDREADSGPQRVAPAYPVPHFEHVFAGNAELYDFRRICGNADEVLREVALGAAARDEPVAHGTRVGHGLERSERLRHHDGERFFGVQSFERAMQVGAVHV